MKFGRRRRSASAGEPQPAGQDRVHICVELQQDDSGYPPYQSEEVDATLIGTQQVRIDGIPVFVPGMARNDVVSVSPPDGNGRMWATAIVQNSAHGTARIVPFPPKDIHSIAPTFISLGCDAHATPFGLVAVDIPPKADVKAVRRALETGRDAGEWDFDYGVIPD